MRLNQKQISMLKEKGISFAEVIFCFDKENGHYEIHASYNGGNKEWILFQKEADRLNIPVECHA